MAIPAEEIQRRLRTHAFPGVIEIYARTVVWKHNELKRALATAEEEKSVLKELLSSVASGEKNREQTIVAQSEEIARLHKAVEKTTEEKLFLQRELKGLQERFVSAQEENAKMEEEYAALQTFVDSRLKPLISGLKRTNGEKDLDLRAKADLIRQLREEAGLCRGDGEGSLAVLRAVEARLADTEEEYAALQTFVDSRLKPLISRLKRTNGEKDLDLRANAELIRQLQMKLEGLSGANSALQEDVAVPRKRVEVLQYDGQSIRGNGRSQRDRSAVLSAERVETEEYRERHSYALRGPAVVSFDDCPVARNAVSAGDAELAKCTSTLQVGAESSDAERDVLLARVEALNTEVERAWGERDTALRALRALEEECGALREQLRRSPKSAVVEEQQRALRALCDDEARRRRMAEEDLRRCVQELERQRRKVDETTQLLLGDGSSLAAQNLALSVRLSDIETVAEELRVRLNDALRRLNEAGEDGEKMREYILGLRAYRPPQLEALLSRLEESGASHGSGGIERLRRVMDHRGAREMADSTGPQVLFSNDGDDRRALSGGSVRGCLNRQDCTPP
ncbi:hypothetical protein DQ04_08131010 [Trypanosoma grayi]|uniref:hypothetical protein n=1 Tax=Trypanosoma grayi TaxID=71804 RepID=UPI0004F41E77|nr:hypothetical protein DQ04_08131010 [Trypanosoma grayi]KEG08050.1 hypothetical protein DQ04_08131010 [Trypanosoma grayi]